MAKGVSEVDASAAVLLEPGLGVAVAEGRAYRGVCGCKFLAERVVFAVVAVAAVGVAGRCRNPDVCPQCGSRLRIVGLWLATAWHSSFAISN